MEQESNEPGAGRYRVGDLDIDLVRRTVHRDGQPLALKGLSFELLACLIRHHPDLASTRDIDREVWGENLVSSSTRTQRVKLLREALAGSPRYPDYLESVKSRGYRLIVPVRPADGEDRRDRRIRAPLLAGLLAGLSIAMVSWIALRPDDAATPSAMFVLPFDAKAGDVDWAEGIRREIVDQLDAIIDLPVVRVKQVPPAAKDDSVVLEGALRETGQGVELRTRLREPGSGKILWEHATSRAGPGQAPRAATREVASAVAGKVSVRGEAALPEVMPDVPPEAYELYVRARYHGDQYARSDLRRGVQMLDRALEIAPDFAKGYALRAAIYSLAGTPSYGWMTPSEAFENARRDALRALSLDPGLAGPNETIGSILLWYEWNPEAAELSYRRALEADPDALGAWLAIALLRTVQGRHDESMVAIERALEIAPMEAGVHANAGWRLLGARRFEEALEAGRRAAALDPTLQDAFNIQFWALVFLGKPEEALGLPEEYIWDAGRGYALARIGQRDKAWSVYESMLRKSRESYVPPAHIAAVLIGLEEYDKALDWLNRVVEQRSREALFFRSSAIYEPLSDHPRFRNLVERVGIWNTEPGA